MMMFNFFRSKTDFTKEELHIVRAVMSALKPIYTNFLLEIDLNNIVGKKKADPKYYGKGYYNLLFAHKAYESLINQELPHSSSIRNIHIKNEKYNSTQEFALFFAYGVPVAFKLQGKLYKNYPYAIDISRHTVKNSRADQPMIIRKLRKLRVEKLLELFDSFEIEINSTIYHTIKNYDGNYLAVNDKGRVFSLWHDPFRVEKLFENIEEFDKAVSIGAFSIDDYSFL